MAHTRYPCAPSFANNYSNAPQDSTWHPPRPPSPPPFLAELEDTSPPRSHTTRPYQQQHPAPPLLDVHIPSPTLSLWPPTAAADPHLIPSPSSPAPPTHRAGEYAHSRVTPSQACAAPPLRAWSFDVTDEYRYAAAPAYTAGLPPWDRAPANSATSDGGGSPMPSTAGSELMERYFPSPSSWLGEHAEVDVRGRAAPEDLRCGLLPDEPSTSTRMPAARRTAPRRGGAAEGMVAWAGRDDGNSGRGAGLQFTID
ncbi:hypothetical protein CCM_09404 [Cordyceps militaris CM01]|uniref:Uncharacterized protein n=1 Tax=Cordyceps militaris (strain CM01) TaxID=983644 RepID=G3JU75_CORMM|nr:uncharacterized protein CCM_09404 [Cordyceps militaris CM01]EGX87782.1 hypothetical protein CCM_09404 [Cordyceps militaris CM01]